MIRVEIKYNGLKNHTEFSQIWIEKGKSQRVKCFKSENTLYNYINIMERFMYKGYIESLEINRL
jgi:hypothetical protein